MSSRKRKREKRSKSNESEAASQSAEAAEPTEEAAEHEVDGEAAEAEPADADEATPAVSEISELKPRRKRKRAAEPEPAEPDAPEPAASEPEVEDEEEEEEEGFGDDTAKEAPKTRAQLKRVIESLIFVSDQVITAQQLGRITKTKIGEVRETLAELTVDYEGRGIDLVEVNGGYQFRSAAASAPYVRVLVAARPVRLTRAQLETLALIAYRQPITRPEVDDVRGVDSGSAIKVLLDRELIKILGRKDDAGRPLLYGTTPFFLEFFGMNTMQELPTLREFTELSDEHRELFQRKTNDIGDPSAEADVPLSVSGSDAEFEPEPEVAAEIDAEANDEPPIEAEAEAEASDEPLEAEPEASDEPIEAEASDEAFEADADEDELDEDGDEAFEADADDEDHAEVEGEVSDEDAESSPEADTDTPDDEVEPS